MKMPFPLKPNLSPPATRFLTRVTMLAPGWRMPATWLVIGFTVLLASVTVSRATELKLPQLWQTDLQMFLESAGMVADINGDGRDEVLVAGREELFARDGRGKALWGWRTKTRFMTYPAVLARPGQPSLIYVADTGGVLTCLDGNGQEIWHAQLKGPSSWSASVVCDLDGDGKAEVIQTDESGTVWAFLATTGKPLWQAKVKGIPVSPAVGDLDGNGKPEIVVATGEGVVTAINGSGQVLWERNIGGSSPSWATAAPVIFAGADGRGRVAVASSDGQFFCLDSKGEILWQRATRGAAASTISVGDLDFDGRADLCLITQVGVIYRYDESGRLLWEIDMQGRSLAPGAMIDLDGDGKLEYTLCTQDGFLQVLNHTGEFIYRYHFKNRTINVTPTFGDVSADSPGLEMLITGGESGIAFCLGTSAATNAVAHWKSYRGDVRNSGSWFGLRQSVAQTSKSAVSQVSKPAERGVSTALPTGKSAIQQVGKPAPRAAEGDQLSAIQMSPQNLAADEVFTGQPIRFIIQYPKSGSEPLTATAVCIRPDGARQMATTTVLGKHSELLMPVAMIAPGTYHFNWTLKEADGHTLASGERSIVLQPFVNERALVARALTALRSVTDTSEQTLPLSARALLREASSLELEAKAVAPLQDGVPGSAIDQVQAALAKTTALVAHAQRSLAISEVVRQATALGPGTSLIAFEGTMWENRKVDEQLPARAANPLHLARTAVPGEHEPVALNLFNVTDHELLVRVQMDPLTNGIVVTPHRSVGVPTSLGEVAWDALPELDETATLVIPSLASRELWLDVDLAGAKPGEHKLRLRLQALNGAGVLDAPAHPHSVPPPETAVEITLRVPNFAMVPSGDFRLCTWAAPEEANLPDLLAHGNNVFPTTLPGAKYNAQGHLTNSDFSRLDPVLGRLRGKDVVLLLQGLPALKGEVGSAGHLDDLKKFLAELVAHLAGAGFDTNHFALYPFDEPGGVGWSAVNQLVAFGKQVRAVNPGIMLYMDGGGELPMFQAMAPVMDIWTPSIYMLAEKTPLMDVVRRNGKMLWSYNCGYAYTRPIGPNIKNMNLIGDYRNAALLAFRHGATGIGYWCYNLGGDPWGRVDMEYQLVYPGRTKPVTSRRWEAVREGIEDYRILAALRKLLVTDGDARLGAATRDRIKHLLEFSLPGMIDQSLEEMTRGLGRNVIDASNNDATIRAFRREMIECVEAVAGTISR
ncbi:MAG: VCBS repeat-containing protein [Verrucomicrobia bacterium]|nr:VCBS repeat-containing protein [Verrucomicrobiota bacterium]